MAYAKNENIPSHQHRDFATWQEHSAGIAEQGRGRTFWANHPMMWAYLIIGAAVSTVVTLKVANVLKPWGLAGSTAPFVFTTWLLLLGADFI